MGILSKISTWFWNEHMWLPPNFSWKEMEDTSVTNFAQFQDLKYGFVIAIVLLVTRYFLEKFVFCPLGIYFGLKPKVIKVLDNPILEKAFCENGRVGCKQFDKVQGLAKQLDWSERRVERWIRKRISKDRPTTLSKFSESGWRFTFYFSSFCYGFYALYDKSWLWNTRECWYGYPYHNVTNDMWWYYMLELGFYWSLTISQFMDIKRKDFMQMFVHHIVTILLLTFSWMSNLFRIGSLVLIIHDFADVPLEAAKMAKYIEKHYWANVTFGIFTVAWIVSRLLLYPYRIIYAVVFEATTIVPYFPAYYVFSILLTALQVLHIVWTWFIVRIALQALSSSQKGVKDLRSDSECGDCSSSSTEDPHAFTNNVMSSQNCNAKKES